MFCIGQLRNLSRPETFVFTNDESSARRILKETSENTDVEVFLSVEFDANNYGRCFHPIAGMRNGVEFDVTRIFGEGEGFILEVK